jgi:hypothetical protein
VAGSPGGTVNATVTGVAQTPAQLTISPAVQNFFVGTFGGSDDRFMTVGNTGTQVTGTIDIQITGPDADQFSLPTGGCPPVSGTACSLRVRFTKPLGSLGDKHATLTISATPGGAAVAQLVGN